MKQQIVAGEPPAGTSRSITRGGNLLPGVYKKKATLITSPSIVIWFDSYLIAAARSFTGGSTTLPDVRAASCAPSRLKPLSSGRAF